MKRFLVFSSLGFILVAAVVFATQPGPTAIQLLANTMAPGDWALLDASSGVTGVAKPTSIDTVVASQGGGADGNVFAGFGVNMSYDPKTNAFYYLGGDHDPMDGAPGSLIKAKWIHWDLADNTFRQNSYPAFVVPISSHQYYSNAIDVLGRHFYYQNPVHTNEFERLTSLDSANPGTWVNEVFPFGGSIKYSPTCWSPERQSVLLTQTIFNNSTDDEFAAVREFRDGWSDGTNLTWQGVTGGTFPTGYYRMGDNQQFCEHDDIHHGMRFGGGLPGNPGAWAAINGSRKNYFIHLPPVGTPAPFGAPGDAFGVQSLDDPTWGGALTGGLGVTLAITVMDPVTGDMFAATNGGQLWKQHLVMNSSGVITNSGSQWSQITLPSPVTNTSTGIFTPNLGETCGVLCGTVVAKVNDVTVWITCTVTTPVCRVWLHKDATAVATIPDAQTFSQRILNPGTVRSFDFESYADLPGVGTAAPGALNSDFGVVPVNGNTTIYPMSIDTASPCAGTAASGSGAMKMVMNPNMSGTGGDNSDITGSWFTNFTPDLSWLAGEGDDVWFQFRQCWDNTAYFTYQAQGHLGKKQSILSAGNEKPGNYDPANSDYPGTDGSGNGIAKSCTWIEWTLQNTQSFGVPQSYQSCGDWASAGFTFHDKAQGLYGTSGPPNNFTTLQDQFVGCTDNAASAMPSDISGCVKFYAGEWMTFTGHVHPGPLHQSPPDCCGWYPTMIQLWVARQGGPPQLITNNLAEHFNNYGGSPRERIGKLWLTSYITGAVSCPSCTTFTTWYDSVIISHNPIPDAITEFPPCVSGAYTVSAEPLARCTPYLGGLFKTVLPGAGTGGPMTHLDPNSAAIVSTVFPAGANHMETVFGSATTSMPSGTNTHSYSNARDNPTYYSSASDPLWTFDCTSSQCGGDLHTGFQIHIPAGAHFSNTVGDNVNDSLFNVWDQSTHEILELFATDNAGGTFYADRTFTGCPGSCTKSLALGPITGNAVPESHLPDYNQNPSYISSLKATPLALSLTKQDFIGGQITHPLALTSFCENGSTVFPNTTGSGAGICGTITNRPANGAWFFLDYTDAQIASMSINAAQKILLTGMAHYGFIQSETAGDMFNTYTEKLQGDEAFALASVADPLAAWFVANGVPCTGPGGTNDPICRYFVLPFSGVPNLTGPSCAIACSYNGHIHLADPCVAQSMAGVGGCLTPGPDTLQFSINPGTIVSGTNFSPIVTVTALTSPGGMLDGTFNSPITLTLNGCGTSSTGTLTVTAGTGTAAFSGLGATGAATGCAYTASAAGLTSGVSSAFNVTGGAIPRTSRMILRKR